MVIKSYLGKSVAEALKNIRAELGPKAMVLKTRTLNAAESGTGSRMVEITACLENPSVGALNATLTEPAMSAMDSQVEKASSIERANPQVTRNVGVDTPGTHHNQDAHPSLSNESLDGNAQRFDRRRTLTDDDEFARRLEEKLDLILERQNSVPLGASTSTDETHKIAQTLLDQDVPERFVRQFLNRLSARVSESPDESMQATAERLMTEEFARYCVPEFRLHNGDRALFIGPSGAGKTSALGKIAAETLFTHKVKTELSTLDDFRVAAQEEIEGYSEALGAGFLDVSAQANYTDERTDRAVLIDCHSNVFDQRQYTKLIEKTRAIKPTIVLLTISALTRSSDLSRIIKRFSAFNPTHLLVTHNDLTEKIGGIYTVLRELGIKLAALSNSPGSLGTLQSPDPAALARTAMGRTQ